MKHYHDDVEFYSPFIAQLNIDENGRIKGKKPLEEYFIRSLKANPDLKFQLLNVLEGVDSVVIHYISIKNKMATEMMVLNQSGQIIQVRNHYKQL
eukprot:gene4742-5918_t